jgi:hypothetical protein
MRTHLISAAGAIAMAVIASAPAHAETKPASTPGACFQAASVSGWSRVDEKTVRVQANGGKQFDLELMSPPPSSLFQEDIVLKAEPSGSVCTGNGLGVSVVTGGMVAAPSYQVVKVTQAPSVAEERAARKAKKEQEKAHEGH